MRKELEECMSDAPLPRAATATGCRKSSWAVTVGGMNITDFCRMPVTEELQFIDSRWS